MASLTSKGTFSKLYSWIPIIILFISVLNEFDFNYLNLEYFSFNFPFILIFLKSNYVHIPKTYDNLSNNRLLTMSWLEGKSILEYKMSSHKNRNIIAKNMFYTWYKPFYEFGIIHGDPHLGNYTVQKDLSINLFDFGCMRIFNGKFTQGVIDLYYALQNNDEEKAVHAYTQWGFSNMNKQKLKILFYQQLFLNYMLS